MRPARRAPAGRLALVVCLLAAALAGCRPGTALHGRYSNFRAYYNTYYNAVRSLEEGERSLQTGDTRVDLDRLVPLFTDGAEGSRAPSFQQAIDKSAELLRTRGATAWADDALLLIGKAFFYQRNVVGAEQKFRETIAVAESRSHGRLADEARFWLGRTLAAAGRFDDGVGVLQTALASPDGDRRWRARMALALAELYAWAGRWDAAAPALRDGLRDIRDPDLAARGYLLLGQVEEAAGRYPAAAEAYAAALRERPSYELTYAALVSEALVLGLHAGQGETALDRLRRMRRDDKHYARRAEVALAYARVLAHQGQADDAEALYRDVLYDPALAGGAVRGLAHARLAEFYRDVRRDDALAAAHFDTAAAALPDDLTPDEHPTRSALRGIDDMAVAFGVVARTTRRLEAIDSLLALGALDPAAFDARIAALEAVRLATWQADQQRLTSARDQQDFGGTGAPLAGDSRGFAGRAEMSTGAEDAEVPAGTPGGAESGFLNYRDASSLQANRLAFERTWGDRPLSPNWRRLAATRASAASAGAGALTGARGFQGPGGGPPPLDLSAVPRTAEQQDALRAERAQLWYQLGNAYFLSLGRTNDARRVYEQILDEQPGTPVARQTRYALAELEASGGNEARARALYADVAREAPADPLGRAAEARAAGRDLTPDDGALPADDPAYAQARRLSEAGFPLAAARAFVQQGDAAPHAATAPRAYLAAAAAYAAWAAGDSLRLAAPLPDSLRSAVLFPATEADVRDSPDAPAPADATAPAERSEPDADTASEGLPRDSTASLSSPTPNPTLREWLLAVASRYPATPYAARANALARALPQPDAEPPDAEATATALPAGARNRDDDQPAASDDLSGAAPLDPSAGGVTWRLQSLATIEEARVSLASLGAGRYRASIASDGALYYVLAGQFPDIATGESTRARLPGWAQPVATLVAIGGFTLLPAVEEEDGPAQIIRTPSSRTEE